MSYLLDTHYILWAITDSKKISKRISDLIIDPDLKIFVSTISFLEISLKSALGKIKMSGIRPEDIPALCTKIGFDIIGLTADDSSSYHNLNASHHKDPFDRMLIWQAICNNYTLISADEQIGKYRSEGLSILTK
jgi:PIN domain nuclease of toxin-antitoxin system